MECARRRPTDRRRFQGEAITYLLRLSHEWNLDLKSTAAMIGVKQEKFVRWMIEGKRQMLPRGSLIRMELIEDITWRLLMEMRDSSRIAAWLQTPNRSLRGWTPLNFLTTSLERLRRLHAMLTAPDIDDKLFT